MINFKSAIINLIYVFSFFLPVSQEISTVIIVILAGLSMFRIKHFKLNKSTFLVLIYVLYVLSAFSTKEVDPHVLERKASLIAFPLIFSVTPINKESLIKIFKAFVYGCLISVLICELQALYHAVDFSSLTINSAQDSSLTIYESIASDKNRFFSFNFSILHQPVYFSMYLIFAIVLLAQDKVFANRKIKLGLILMLLLAILQTLNKSSLVVLFTIILLHLLQFQKNYGRRVIFLMPLFMIALIFVFNPRFNSFYNKTFFLDKSKMVIKDFKEIKNTNPNDYNFRIMLWSSSIDLIKENPFFGVGASVSSIKLNEVFAVKRQWYDRSERYHAHNQYLQILLDLGIVGFIVFLWGLISFLQLLYLKRPLKVNTIMVNFSVILLISFMFESVFERYSGITFFCLFFCLFTNYNKEIV
jgi:O-antigen ligase